MKRTLLEDEHREFAESFRTFLTREVVPHHEKWEKDGIVPRELFTAAGESGYMGMAIPEEYGGAGVDDFRFNLVLAEEAQMLGCGSFGLGLTLHNDICIPYFMEYATEEQRQRWFPGLANGELFTAIAMTEPGAGSDLAGIKTSAKRDGDTYIVNGGKTFITNGINADLAITAVKTNPKERHKGMSILVLEKSAEGYEHGRKLEKLGLHGQDTAELFFNDMVVPESNRLGEEGAGFSYLVHNLAQERISIAGAAVASCEAALEWTITYVRERKAFGAPIGALQNTRFELAEMKTEVDVARVYLDRCIEALNAGDLSVEDAAAAKWWTTELQGRVMDKCVQLFGGYGYMLEYPIARAFADARITRIYGGTTEIMKEIVGRSMNLG